jgi:hypothetical protein
LGEEEFEGRLIGSSAAAAAAAVGVIVAAVVASAGARGVLSVSEKLDPLFEKEDLGEWKVRSRGA